jgi:Leucine-rich repeat (LRR) protein
MRYGNKLLLRKLFLIYGIFILLGCKKTAAKPSETTTPEYFGAFTQEYSEIEATPKDYSKIQENTDIGNWWRYDNFRDIAKDPQKAQIMLVYYLEKQDKTTSKISITPFKAGNFTDYTPFLAFKNLTELYIDNDLITDISGITVLSQHEKFSELFLWTENVTDLRPLSALVNLRFLSVSVSKTYNVTSELLPLVRLEHLAFSHATAETIRSISKLTWLKRLFIGLDNEDIDISPIQNLKNLECLEITGPIYKQTEFNISWIGQLVKLQEIELSRVKITDVTPFLKLPKIEEIDVMWSEISDENIALLKKTGAVVYTYADADR